MKKVFIKVIALCCAFALIFPIYAFASGFSVEKRQNLAKADWKYDFPNGAAPVSIELDSKTVLVGESAIIDSVTYVPVRSFSELCGADSVEWDAKTNTAIIKKEKVTVKISDRLRYVEASCRYFYADTPIRNINDRLFAPIRLLCSAFSVDVVWNASSRCVELTSTNKTLASASEFYNSDDIYWLSRIINAEAGGEPFLGKIAVGNVVINRKDSKMYPNTIYGVIFDRKNGTQFSPVALGTIYRTPNEDSIIAAKICLEGYSIDDAVLFFMNPKIATNNWISQNRKFAFNIGNHYFFY